MNAITKHVCTICVLILKYTLARSSTCYNSMQVHHILPTTYYTRFQKCLVILLLYWSIFTHKKAAITQHDRVHTLIPTHSHIHTLHIFKHLWPNRTGCDPKTKLPRAPDLAPKQISIGNNIAKHFGIYLMTKHNTNGLKTMFSSSPSYVFSLYVCSDVCVCVANLLLCRWSRDSNYIYFNTALFTYSDSARCTTVLDVLDERLLCDVIIAFARQSSGLSSCWCWILGVCVCVSVLAARENAAAFCCFEIKSIAQALCMFVLRCWLQQVLPCVLPAMPFPVPQRAHKFSSHLLCLLCCLALFTNQTNPTTTAIKVGVLLLCCCSFWCYRALLMWCSHSGRWVNQRSHSHTRYTAR